MHMAIETLNNAFIPYLNRALIDSGFQDTRIHLVDFGSDNFIDRDPTEPFHPPDQRPFAGFLDKDGRYRKDVFVNLKQELWDIGLQ